MAKHARYVAFDVWEVEAEPDVVYLYEAYKDKHAFESHKLNEPYKKWTKSCAARWSESRST